MPLSEIIIKKFSDTETYVKVVEKVRGDDVFIIQPTSRPVNESLMELLIIIDAMKRSSVGEINVVIPYFGYARQDKSFTEGEAVSARLMARHISMGCDRVFTIDIHKVSVLEAFTVQAENLSAMPEIGRFLAARKADVIVSPDKGSVDRAGIAARAAGLKWDFLEKKRLDGSTVEIKPKSMDVKGRTVAIVDDIIATGRTVITAAGQLKAQGAARVLAACTHGLYTGGSLPKLEAAFDGVYSTDTLESPTSAVSAAGCIAMALGNLSG